VKLNLGAGRIQISGYVNIDVDPTMEPDLVADAESLPFEDGSVDEIYASHILEHLRWDSPALTEWFRVLKHGGLLTVAVPDIVQTYFLYKHGVNWGAYGLPIDVHYLNACVFGSKYLGEIVPEMQKIWPKMGGTHQQIFIFDMLTEAVVAAGFDEVHEVTACEVRTSDLGETMVQARKFDWGNEPWCLRRRDPLPEPQPSKEE
jgi:SAM-dependent methyltransferase